MRERHKKEAQEEGEDDDENPFELKRKSAKSEPPKRIAKIDKKVNATYYFYKHMYGCANDDSSDEEFCEAL